MPYRDLAFSSCLTLLQKGRVRCESTLTPRGSLENANSDSSEWLDRLTALQESATTAMDQTEVL
jgi:hypothetical protein